MAKKLPRYLKSFMSNSTETSIFFIGDNDSGEFGLGHTNPTDQLIKCPNKLIIKIFCSNYYSIYSADNYDNLWAAVYSERDE